MAYVPAISRLGLVETIEAKLYARFGHFSDAYLTGMLRGVTPPKHVYAEAERLRKERFWEQADKPVAKKEKTADWWARMEQLGASMVKPEPKQEEGSFWDKIIAQAKTKPCVCGHSIEEHGNDFKFPGSTSCSATLAGDGEEILCDCIAYEANSE